MFIVNLTQHPPTPEQIADGVRSMAVDERAALRGALTFDELPSAEEISARAEFIANLAVCNGLGEDGDDPFPDAAMIGGAPYLMSALERELTVIGIKPVYAFSIRESQEVDIGDGVIEKRAVFRHAGFVDAVLEDPRQSHDEDGSDSPR